MFGIAPEEWGGVCSVDFIIVGIVWENVNQHRHIIIFVREALVLWLVPTFAGYKSVDKRIVSVIFSVTMTKNNNESNTKNENVEI